MKLNEAEEMLCSFLQQAKSSWLVKFKAKSYSLLVFCSEAEILRC